MGGWLLGSQPGAGDSSENGEGNMDQLRGVDEQVEGKALGLAHSRCSVNVRWMSK